MFRPIRTRQIASDIYGLNGIISNFYVIRAGEHLLAFDTGIHPLWSKRSMKKLQLDPAKVTHVFLTHSDYDHAAGLPAFPNATLYLSAKEEVMVTGQMPRMLIKYNKKQSGYQLLDNLECVNINDREIKLIEAPGHTPGSACYLIDNTILVTGDTILISRSGKISPFSFIQNMDHKQNKATVSAFEKQGLFDIPSLILTGHTGVFKR